EPEALRHYVKARAQWLRGRPLRRPRIYLFFSGPPTSRAQLDRGQLGLRLMFKSPEKIAAEFHREQLKSLGLLRDRLASRLKQLGLGVRELTLDDVTQLHYELLNPSRSSQGLKPPSVTLRDPLWSPATVGTEGDHLREYTEAEQLCFEDLDERPGHLHQ